MDILNFLPLAITPLRKKALLIAEAGYNALNIKKAVSERIFIDKDGLIQILGQDKKSIFSAPIDKYEKIVLVGIGKGSYRAVSTLRKKFGKIIKQSIALDCRKIYFAWLKNLFRNNFFVCQGTHPIPSKKNVLATKKIIEIARSLNENDLLISFVCGGGSALGCSSFDEAEKSAYVIKELTHKGADIIELNTVRKHLSEFKGGGLSKFAYPANILSLIVSDVLGNDLSMVASGPTVYDNTTKENAEAILEKYGVEKERIKVYETPKEEKFFEKTKNLMFVSNKEVIFAMSEKAKELKLTPKTFSLDFRGEAKDALVALIKETNVGEAVFAAGETTITFNVKNPGKGGRNMESSLGVLNYYYDQGEFPENLIATSLASDGKDNTPAAGALADHLVYKSISIFKMDIKEAIRTHGTYDFFKKSGGLVYVAKSSFNVADFMIVIKDI